MTRTAGVPIGCQRSSRFWELGCPIIYHEVEDTLVYMGLFGGGDKTFPSGIIARDADVIHQDLIDMAGRSL
ncbi:hypothetical protein [Thiolapillus sp.]|uniref:hypothetical protein n=1 Tax=Thiolapillus sp. TaxID=2017437 RepID=UPI0025F1968A|nr:hypothetical protein [Thiolapillus sp.]